MASPDRSTPEYKDAMNAIARLSPRAARQYLQTALDLLFAQGAGTPADPNRLEWTDPDTGMVVELFQEIASGGSR